MNKVVIVIQFNNAYFRFGLTLLRSLEKYAKNAVKVAYTVNLTDDEIKTLKNISSELIIINSRVFLWGRLLRNFMANRKVGVFMDAISRYSNCQHTSTPAHQQPDNIYILLDADLLLRMPIENLLNALGKHNVGLVYREIAFGFHVKFNSSVVIVSGDGIKLIDEWNRQMKRRWVIFSTDEKLTRFEILKKKKEGSPRPLYVRRGKWFWDQITLYEAVRKLQIDFSILEANKFINANFDACAAIWSGHNDKKDVVYKKYIDELKLE